jgi:hypothetical protein
MNPIVLWGNRDRTNKIVEPLLQFEEAFNRIVGMFYGHDYLSAQRCPSPAEQTRQYEGNFITVGCMGLLGGW